MQIQKIYSLTHSSKLDQAETLHVNANLVTCYFKNKILVFTFLFVQFRFETGLCFESMPALGHVSTHIYSWKFK